MINLDEIEYFSMKDTLKNLSRNAASYMTESDIMAISFDKAKEEYAKRYHLKVMPTSNDALFQVKGRIFFVEFKDGNIGYELQKNRKFRLDDIERKIYDSLFLFCDIANQHISDTRQYMTYILVYNHERNKAHIQDCFAKTSLETDETQYSSSYEKIVKYVGQYASTENPDLFGLRKRVSALYFSALRVYDKEEFSDFLEDLEKLRDKT